MPNFRHFWDFFLDKDSPHVKTFFYVGEVLREVYERTPLPPPQGNLGLTFESFAVNLQGSYLSFFFNYRPGSKCTIFRFIKPQKKCRCFMPCNNWLKSAITIFCFWLSKIPSFFWKIQHFCVWSCVFGVLGFFFTVFGDSRSRLGGAWIKLNVEHSDFFFAPSA